MLNIKQSIPNLLTLTSVGCGFTTLVQLLEANYVAAMFWMFAAIVFDGIDGKAANLLGVKTETGPILDSLSDVISFAFLPGFSLYLFYHNAPQISFWTEVAAWVVGIGYTLGGLMRLVRFTAEQTDRTRGEGFLGLPSPPPAGLMIGFVALAGLFPNTLYHPAGFVFMFLLAGLNVYLMTLSNINYLRWGARGITLQTSASIFGAVIAYFYFGTIGAFVAVFYIAFCSVYMYSHVLWSAYRSLNQLSQIYDKTAQNL